MTNRALKPSAIGAGWYLRLAFRLNRWALAGSAFLFLLLPPSAQAAEPPGCTLDGALWLLRQGGTTQELDASCASIRDSTCSPSTLEVLATRQLDYQRIRDFCYDPSANLIELPPHPEVGRFTSPSRFSKWMQIPEFLGAAAALDSRRSREFLGAALDSRPSRDGLQELLKAADDMAAAIEKKTFAEVPILYATNRKRHQAESRITYTSERSRVDYGWCIVTIPVKREIGSLPSPTWWRLQFQEDPTKHVILRSVSPTSKEQFFAAVKARQLNAENGDAFIFVHGYNVSFEDAARRTGQLAHDLNFRGSPVFFSWPSSAQMAAYPVDAQNMEWAERDLREFLVDFFAKSDAKRVFLIGHSMGTRGLTRALISAMRIDPSIRTRLTELILTAPDIDADVFSRDLAPALLDSKAPITLYASRHDLALKASKKFQGYVRAGDAGENLLVIPGIETIDASSVDTSFMGHSYFAETRTILTDMFYLVRQRARAPNRFGLQEQKGKQGSYWVVR